MAAAPPIHNSISRDLMRRTVAITLRGAFCLQLILGGLPAACAAARAPVRDPWGNPLVRAGDPVPDLPIRDLDGGTLSLSDLGGRVVLLSFWVSWCGECHDQAPLVQQLFDAYRTRGLRIVGISYDTDRTKAETFRRDHEISWPIDYTGRGFWENQLGRMFHVEDTGTILLVRDGILEGGYRDLEQLRKRLEKILPADRDP
ncbi:MAG TPA: TlpA disulfide reductase family protein [Candidatus Binatia bacterium]|nr:TlpA disulfide reductase family protein [Candidatus Binatia bacterium]